MGPARAGFPGRMWTRSSAASDSIVLLCAGPALNPFVL